MAVTLKSEQQDIRPTTVNRPMEQMRKMSRVIGLGWDVLRRQRQKLIMILGEAW
jgi:hypothetical protein